MSASTSPCCPPHQRPAVATCARCGTFLCAECTELLGEAAWCASCLAFLRQHGPASRGVRAVLGVGLAGLLGLPLAFLLLRFSWVGLWLLVATPWLNALVAVLGPWPPLRELRRISRGERPLRGRPLAWWALGLVLANLVLALYGFSAEHSVWFATPA